MNAAPSSSNDVATKIGHRASVFRARSRKISPDLFLWAAGAAMVASGIIQFMGVRRVRRFAPPLFAIGRRVELLAPMLLMLGVYKKLTNVAAA